MIQVRICDRCGEQIMDFYVGGYDHGRWCDGWLHIYCARALHAWYTKPFYVRWFWWVLGRRP